MTLRAESWKERAACADPDVNPEIFFPAGTGARDAVEARVYCYQCPVISECSESGLHEGYGIWGGLTERQRNKARKAAQRGAA